MIGWIKRRIWRKRLETRSEIAITVPVFSSENSSSVHSLRDLRELLESADFEKIIEVLSTKLKEMGLNDRDSQLIVQNLNQEKVKVVIRRVGLLASLDKREAERHTNRASSPLSR